jgi:hypothetical protein
VFRDETESCIQAIAHPSHDPIAVSHVYPISASLPLSSVQVHQSNETALGNVWSMSDVKGTVTSCHHIGQCKVNV